MNPMNPSASQDAKGFNPSKEKELERLLVKLRGLVQRTNSSRLPTIRNLCKHFQCSKLEITQALHELRREGVLKFGRGKPLQIVSKESSERVRYEKQTSAEKLAGSLEDRISRGIYRNGDVLPKIITLRLTFHVSLETVVKACKLLSSRDRIHKSGKKWVIGPKIPFQPPDIVTESLCILVLTPSRNTWRSISQDRAAGAFYQRFTQEAQVQNVKIQIGILNRQNSPYPTLPCGKSEIEKRIKELGPCYAGCLIAGQGKAIPNISDWIEWLQIWKRPIAWFQWNEQSKGESQKRFHVSKITPIAALQEKGVAVGLRFLEQNGHKRIGYPDFDGLNQGGASFTRVVEIGREVSSLTMVQVASPIDFWRELEGDKGNALIRKMGTSGPQYIKQIISQKKNVREAKNFFLNKRHHEWTFALSLYPMLEKYLRRRHITALLAKNDLWAKRTYFCIRACNFKVPQKMSILSLGNTGESIPFPISSVDLGYGQLGHQTFHLFLNHARTKKPFPSQLYGEPTIIRRGSVGKVQG